MFMLRFDMRAPLDGPAETADLYQAAIEMAEWGESRGCVTARHTAPTGTRHNIHTRTCCQNAAYTCYPLGRIFAR